MYVSKPSSSLASQTACESSCVTELRRSQWQTQLAQWLLVQLHPSFPSTQHRWVLIYTAMNWTNLSICCNINQGRMQFSSVHFCLDARHRPGQILAHYDGRSPVSGGKLPRINSASCNVFDGNRTKTCRSEAPKATLVFRVPPAIPSKNSDGWDFRNIKIFL